MVDLVAVQADPMFAGQQRSGRPAVPSSLANVGTALRAVFAGPAGGNEAHHDMIARLGCGDALANLNHDARCLMPRHHWRRLRQHALDHGQVRMTQPRRAGLDQQFARAWRCKINLLHPQWFGLSVGRWQALFEQNGGFHFHGGSSVECSGTSFHARVHPF